MIPSCDSGGGDSVLVPEWPSPDPRPIEIPATPESPSRAYQSEIEMT